MSCYCSLISYFMLLLLFYFYLTFKWCQKTQICEVHDFYLVSPFTLSQPVQLIGSSQPISLEPAADLGEGLQFEQAVGVQTASTWHLCYQLYFHLYLFKFGFSGSSPTHLLCKSYSQLIKTSSGLNTVVFMVYASSPALITTKSPQLFTQFKVHVLLK